MSARRAEVLGTSSRTVVPSCCRWTP